MNYKTPFLTLIALFLWGTSIGKASQVEEKDYVGYLFTYFTGNHISEEAICFGVSMDGYSFYALNDNNGNTFYMVATDMVSDNGWDSNRAMVMLKSNNLVNWSHSVINIQKRYKGQEKLKRVWAPQTIFDKEAGQYMVYWSMQYEGGPDVIYYAYANEDFTDLTGEPKPLFIPADKKSCIDGDIVYKDGIYHLFYKNGRTRKRHQGSHYPFAYFRRMERKPRLQTTDQRGGRRCGHIQTDRTGQIHPDV